MFHIMLLLVYITTPRVAAWPEDDAWSPIMRSGAPLSDISGDNLGHNPVVDLLGESTESEAAAFWFADDTNVYFRLRVATDPEFATDPWSSSTMSPGSWGILLDTDGDPSAYEYSLAVGGEDITFSLMANTLDQKDGVADYAEDILLTFHFKDVKERLRSEPAGTSLDGDDDWFLDLYIERQELASVDVLHDSDVFQVVVATSSDSSPQMLDADICAFDDSDGLGSIADGLSDPMSLDEDGDGLLWFAEEDAGTDPLDADTDDDGLLDGAEYAAGTDPLSCDSDGDGLTDGLESGVQTAHADTDTDAGCFTADSDPSTTTDPTVADTDGGGVTDGAEDRDGDGAVDEWETSPLSAEDDADLDSDGVPDALESLCGGSDSDDADGDGIEDTNEGMEDTDMDGVPDFCDTDSDDDGIPDVDEGEGDTDDDGIPDFRDTDSDDDGIPDADEGTVDSDCDDEPAFQDSNETDGPCGDPDGDGLDNEAEAACGTDPSNPDSDGDGTLDADDDCPTAAPGDTGRSQDSGHPRYNNGRFSGGCEGCSQSPVRSPWALLPLAALLLLRRRRRAFRWLAATLFTSSLLSVSTANAQDLNVQAYRPVVGEPVFTSLWDSVATTDGPSLAVITNYANDPFVYRYTDPGMSEEHIIWHLITSNLLAGYSLSSKHFIGRKAAFVFLIIPMYFSGGLIPTYIAVTRWYGLFNSRLALILPTAVSMFYVIVFRNIISYRIPRDVLDSAEMDGAGDFTVLFRILVPLMFPVIAAFTIFSAVAYWNMWFEVLIYIQDRAKWTLQFLLKVQISDASAISRDSTMSAEETEVTPQNLQMAALLLSIAPVVTIYPFLQRFFIHGVLVGAVKG